METIQEEILSSFNVPDQLPTEKEINEMFDDAKQITIEYLNLNKQIDNLLVEQKELRYKLQEIKLKINDVYKTL